MEKLKPYSEFINEAAFDVETEIMNWMKAGNVSEENGDKVPDAVKTFIESKKRGNVIDLGGGKTFVVTFSPDDRGAPTTYYFVKAKDEEIAKIAAFLVWDKFELTNDDLGGDLENSLEPRGLIVNSADISKDVNYL
jgi:hypothetical protein